MSQIKATIIADSVSAVNGQRITTFELEYPRFIHSELTTHRLFSRNSMSSRAVPIEKMIAQVTNDPALPVHWGKNQPGMQARVEIEDPAQAVALWEQIAETVACSAERLNNLGLHKQVVNRILEPFQTMKTVMTATCMDNFFWLRNHEDAQPEIKRLAELMWEALQESTPVVLNPGDWHVPYYYEGSWKSDEYEPGTLQEALAISSSCCAQVSYRTLDDTLEKARKVYQRLVESTPVHASPFEHQASPATECLLDVWDEDGEYSVNTHDPLTWEQGITSCDKEGNLWSGNFKSWIQYRQLIEGNVCNKFEGK